MNSLSSNTAFSSDTVLQIECTKLQDNTVHRQYVRITKVESDKMSVQYFRDLIEKELDIPVVCQVRLVVNGVPLDPLPSDFTEFPNRLFKPGEPINISLDYYTAGADLYSIRSTLNKFYKSISSDEIDYDELSSSLDLLEVSCFNVSWSCDEAVGARLCITSSGFLPKLHYLMKIVNSNLRESLVEFNAKGDSCPLNTVTSIVHTYHILTQAFSNLMLLSARWEDKMLICENDFPSVIRETLAINALFFETEHVKLHKIGFNLLYYCFSELQLLLSVRSVSVQFGLHQEFLDTLRDSIIGKARRHVHQTSNAICLFNLSGSAAVSHVLYSSDVYSDVIKYYLKKNLLTTIEHHFYELYFRACLTTLHMLKTPNLVVTSEQILKDSALLLRTFLSTVTANEIADSERESFCFGTLENYISLIYLPSNSMLGSVIQSKELGVKYATLKQDFASLGVFSMEVLMLLDAGRRVILSEDLLPHLVIADWKIGRLQSKIRTYFPEITYFPVPRLYDIAAMNAVYMGIGDYKEMMHFRFN